MVALTVKPILRRHDRGHASILQETGSLTRTEIEGKIMAQPDFDSIKQTDPYGNELWSARKLMPLLGYGRKWQNFEAVVKKARVACQESGNIIEDHFTGVSKMVTIGSESQRDVKDYQLSRFACYLIAQNGDSRKQEIALAQTYFAVSFPPPDEQERLF